MTTHTRKRRMKEEEKRNFFFKSSSLSHCVWLHGSEPEYNDEDKLARNNYFLLEAISGECQCTPPPIQLHFFPLPSPLFITDMGVCAMSSVDGELSSSCCVSPIIRAAASSSVRPFSLPPFSLSISALVKKNPLFQDLLSPPTSFLFLAVPSPSPCSLPSSSTSPSCHHTAQVMV